MLKARPYLEPGTEVDCAYYVGEREFVRCLLTLPGRNREGRVRFAETVPTLDLSADNYETIALRLLDTATGTPACLLDSFLKTHRFRAPMPPSHPIELYVNAALIGTDNAAKPYEQATVQSKGLLEFMRVTDLTVEAVAAGATHAERTKATSRGVTVRLSEGADIASDAASVTMNWHGELTMHGSPKPLREWASSLGVVLGLFALLCDQPLVPERIYATTGDSRTDFYASWTEAEAPTRTAPLARLKHVEHRLEQVVGGWLTLVNDARDLVDHLTEYQLRRDRMTLPDRALLLSRCLELYHAYKGSYGSVIRPKQAHRELVAQVLELLPNHLREPHEEWIEGALKEANRKRLVAQIRDILDDLGSDVLEKSAITEPGVFAATLKSSRNFFTHPRGEPPKDLPEGRALLVLVNQAWFVLRACVLVELGFEASEIASALERSSARHYILQ